jgi:SWI/SNF-related matrix-associated actin-dependent regulator of chromatin subfamily A3
MSRKRSAEAYEPVRDISSSQPHTNPSSSASQGYPYANSQSSTPQDPYSYREPPTKQARTAAYDAAHAYNATASAYASNGNVHASNGYGHASNSGRGSSQANPYVLTDDDEDDGSQEVQDATQGYNDQEYGWGYYGVLPTKIVGVRYYSGVATEGEIVVLRREPHNAYDRKFCSISSSPR